MNNDPHVKYLYSKDMEILRENKISENVLLAEVQKFPDELYRKQLSDWLLTEYPFLKWRDSVGEQGAEKLQILGENLKDSCKIRVGLFVKGELRGWSFGWQDSADSFYMGASAIDPDLRRKGYYSQLVRYVLDRTCELGFQSVSSNHILVNNKVIIAKLKLGFTIKGIEVDAVHGTLLRINYHHNELMKKAARFRAGAISESDVLQNLRTDA